ncbi:hypothetical protein JG688_00006789 [Phytophthora aleatoria]|uniref:Uncharacterized protein n=1 Tax=Phytophthora aleatoria TaxID=2496075 RepID=A0A8J5MGL7_9STRA|nr:hypothetical protein JG688_00006789 [Phytophthora aleatoria]
MTPKGFEPCSSQSVGEVSAFTLSRLKVKFIKSGMIQVTASTNGIPDYREHTWENVAGIVLYYACLGIALQYLENPKRYQIHFGLCKIRKPSRLAFHRMLHRFVVFLAKFGTLQRPSSYIKSKSLAYQISAPTKTSKMPMLCSQLDLLAANAGLMNQINPV